MQPEKCSWSSYLMYSNISFHLHYTQLEMGFFLLKNSSHNRQSQKQIQKLHLCLLVLRQRLISLKMFVVLQAVWFCSC